MIVVADASPLNYLIQIDETHLLTLLYGRVIVPPSVNDELCSIHGPRKVRDWMSSPPDWLSIADPAPINGPQLQDLDLGERDAIELALKMRADLVLMDDWAGRNQAEALGLTVTGTIGVLEEASKRDLVAIGDVLRRLFATNFRISAHLKRRVLAKYGL
jgi:predicted nucleic acid-binding protein